MAAKDGQVSINGSPYRIIMDSYRGRDVSDFAPRATVPGSGAIFSELKLYQPISQTDWRHGFGYVWHDDAMGYASTEGNITTAHADIVMMSTKAVSSDTTNSTKEGFTLFGTNLYAWGSGGLHKYNGTAWSSVYSTAAVNFALTNGKYLFFCPDGLRIKKMDSAGTITDAGQGENARDFKWMHIFSGYIYAGKDMAADKTLGNQIYYGSANDLSDLHGDPDDDTTEIYAGIPGRQILGAENYLADMVLFRPDAIFKLNIDNQKATLILDYADVASDDNFRSWTVTDQGYMIFPIRDQLYRWNGVRVTVITPPRLNDTFPFQTYGRFDNLTRVGRFIYMTARTNDSTYAEHLLCYDGVAFHKVADLVTNGTSTVTGMYYDTQRNYLWYHIQTGTSTNVTSYIPFQSQSEYPYSSFPTTGTHTLITSKYYAGFRMITKSTPSIFIEGDNLSSSSYLLVYYSVDGGTWTAWGTSDGTTNKISSDGRTELTDPLGSGTGNTTLEYYNLQLKIKFVTTSATSSPVLQSVTLRAILRPETVYGYSFDIVVARDIEYDQSTIDIRPPAEILTDLHTARDSKAPVTFLDVFNVSHQVYVTALNEQAIEYIEDKGSSPNIEHVVQVNLVKVG